VRGAPQACQRTSKLKLAGDAFDTQRTGERNSVTTLSYRAPTKADPAKALQRFTAVNPWRWFTHPIVAVVPLIIESFAWLTSDAESLARTSATYFFFLSAVWLIGVLATRATLMGPNRNFVAFCPERLAWLRGQHTLLVERANVESYTREPARHALEGLVTWINEEPLAEHFTLHLYERGLVGYDYLGRTTVSLRTTVPIEVTEPDAFEAALRAWLPGTGVAGPAWAQADIVSPARRV
jgi:hypothetical protein